MAHSIEPAPPEQHGLRPSQYLLIGAVLTVITALELWISYSPLGGLILPLLLILSTIKFATVVAYFMHLRFENGLMARIFVGSLILASLILFALIALFWGDYSGGIQAAREAVKH
jgi:cytochrome c oxidase subunit 4